MPIISLRCKNCGSSMAIDMDAKTVHCAHCGSTFLLGELLDQKDIDVISKLQPNELAEKMEANNEIKKGESKIFAGDFRTAEKHFKRAIALDENNFKGYLGVVKSKTKNFNVIPPEDDYAEYAKLASKHVDKEHSTYLKNELFKLELLKKEKRKKEEQALKKQKESFKQIQKKKKVTNIVLCILLTCVIATACILIPILFKKKPAPKTQKPITLTISSANDLLSFKPTEQNLNANIVLANDIDFENQSIEPIGSRTKPFSGTFNGNGFTISNMKIKDKMSANENALGLFAYTSNATIKNIKFDNCYVSENRNNEIVGNNIIGVLCGVAKNTTFENLEIKNSSQIHLSLENLGTYTIGSICGSSLNSSFKNCYSNASITTNLSTISLGFGETNPLSYYVGGLVGLANATTLNNCYSTSIITTSVVCENSTYAEQFVGGLVGLAEDDKSIIKNSYFAGSISANKNPQTTNNFALISNFNAEILIENSFSLLLNNLLENTENVATNKIADYDLSGNLILTSEAELLSQISTTFNSLIWNNETKTPTLK